MRAARAIFFSWLPLAGATTGILLVAYAGIQQNYRQSLNDPQIQMAEDAAMMLNSGDAPVAVIPLGQTKDISQSLAPWIAVYDESGKPLEGDAILQGAAPMPPLGVLEAAKNGLPFVVGHHLTSEIPANENRISWQPSSDVRQAIVVVWSPNAREFVVAGRNMREVENRIGSLGTMFFLGWLALMAATLFAKILEWYFR